MLTTDFDYPLPPELIAQAPAEPRDSCRLLVLRRTDGSLQHCTFKQVIDFLDPGDLLVANETKVFPARLRGHKVSGGEAEIFLLEPKGQDTWQALVKPGRRLKPGAVVMIGDSLKVSIIDWEDAKGERLVALESLDGRPLDSLLHEQGNLPLPPYIKDYHGPDTMYQTVYAKQETSAAAPTAGLHFTPELIERIKAKGVNWATLELQVGLDTFRSVDEVNIEDHQMHTETYTVPPALVEAIAQTKAAGHRVIAVGTTCVRSLESAWDKEQGKLVARDHERTSLYITPGYPYHVVDALITNFHVPKSTLMMLVSAFASREQILAAYAEAVALKYRFLSFGDAMLIL